MRHFDLRLLVASSLLLVGLGQAARRPQYGGTLHVALESAPSSLDPAALGQLSAVTCRNLSSLLFDTLVTMDDFGRIRPALALSWQANPGNQRWQFQLRPGVAFDDGSLLTSGLVAASLRAGNPSWTIYALENSITIELNSPNPSLAAELTLPKNVIVKRLSGKVSGTGPFRVSDWQPAKRLIVAANEDYWGGRPFVNSVEIVLGTSARDQMMLRELGKTDLIEIAPEQARRTAMEGRRVSESAPLELVALVFTHQQPSPEEGKLLDALALSVDRASIKNVLLQGGGDPAGGILPNWMTGYGFLFRTEFNLSAAQQRRAEVPYAPAWTLSSDRADPLSRLIAERLALNAKDAGMTIRPVSTGVGDLRLVRISLVSVNPRVALSGVTAALGLPQPGLSTDNPEELYRSENALLESHRIIPLFHLPVNYGLSIAVKNWGEKRTGAWDLGEVWLGTDQP
jgi:peptide/nickel transport system substrate-binding protein